MGGGKLNRRRAVLFLILIAGFSLAVRQAVRSRFNFNMDSYNYMLGAKILGKTGHLHGRLGPHGHPFCPHPKWLYKWGYIYFLTPFSMICDGQEEMARWVGLCVSLAGVGCAYGIARSLGTKREGALLTAALLACSYQSIKWSTEVVSDNLGVALVLFSLWLLIQGVKKMPARLVWSAFLLGSAVLVRNEYFLLALPWALHVLLRMRVRDHWASMAGAVLVGISILVLGLGFAAWDLREITPVAYWESSPSKSFVLPGAFGAIHLSSSFFKYLLSEPGLVVFACLGSVQFAREKDPLLLLASLSLISLTLLYMSFHNQQERHFYHLTPFFLLLAARSLRSFPSIDLSVFHGRISLGGKTVLGFAVVCLLVQVGVVCSRGKSAPGFEKEEANTLARFLRRSELPPPDLIITRNWRSTHFYTGRSTQPFQFDGERVAHVEALPEQAVILLIVNDYIRHQRNEIEQIVGSLSQMREVCCFEVNAAHQPWYSFTNSRTRIFQTNPEGIRALRKALRNHSPPRY